MRNQESVVWGLISNTGKVKLCGIPKSTPLTHHLRAERVKNPHKNNMHSGIKSSFITTKIDTLNHIRHTLIILQSPHERLLDHFLLSFQQVLFDMLIKVLSFRRMCSVPLLDTKEHVGTVLIVPRHKKGSTHRAEVKPFKPKLSKKTRINCLILTSCTRLRTVTARESSIHDRF